jgi:hypothetical protein
MMGTHQMAVQTNNAQNVISHAISVLTMEMLVIDPGALLVPKVLTIVTVLFSNA